VAYEPAYGIIGDPAKKNPTTRQSADHSMAYIISTLLRKSFERHTQFEKENSPEDIWKYLMLLPQDYSYNAIYNETTRKFMEKINFVYGGKEYDDQYPKGIPTSITIKTQNGNEYDSGMVLFPGGHAANETVSLTDILQNKFIRLGQLALEKEELVQFVLDLENIGEMTNEQLVNLYECNIKFAAESIDDESTEA